MTLGSSQSAESAHPRLSVSNIAWSAEEDDAAYEILAAKGIQGVEVAPGRIWRDPTHADSGDVPEGMKSRGLSISGFQAILFGRPELLLFHPMEQDRLLEYLALLAATCSRSGGQYLVFGAPRNRFVPEGLSFQKAFSKAVAFFQDLAERVSAKDIIFGIEANPAVYGCNFCTHVEDVVRLVSAIDSPAIRWHLDTGELAMNNENVPDVVMENGALIGSVHISEPHLGDFSSPWSGHSCVAAALKHLRYRGWVSLEMKRPSNGLEGLRRAADLLVSLYA